VASNSLSVPRTAIHCTRSNLINIRLDEDYNKVVDARLQIPLHKGFADASLQVYQFAKPLLKTEYETRVTGHSSAGLQESSPSCC
jgi:hypothetical protein